MRSCRSDPVACSANGGKGGDSEFGNGGNCGVAVGVGSDADRVVCLPFSIRDSTDGRCM